MTDLTFEPHMRVCRTGDILDDDLDGELVMMDIERGSYFGLNKTATRIWVLLEQPIAIKDLCDQLASEFNVPAEQCHQEVLAFLKKLLNRGLLQVVTDERT